MIHLLREQPRAFHMIFLLELWERFGFYTVQGVLTVYLMRYLGYSDVQAYYIFGAFSALVYGLVVIGGFLGDKVLGTKRTMVLGLVVLTLGYFSLAMSQHKGEVFLALALICVGNGLFKANPSSLLAKCYEPRDPRLHSGFTLYYMAINLGSIASLFIGPVVATHYGYVYVYLLSTLGLLLGLLNYWLQHQYIAHIQTKADARRVSWLQWLVIIAGIIGCTLGAAYLLQHVALARNLLLAVSSIVLISYVYLMYQEEKVVFQRMLVALMLMLEGLLFFVLYQQMPTSLNLFAVNNVIPTLFGISIDPQSFQALNPLWIVSLSPVLAYCYSWLNQKKTFLAIPYKFAFGMTMCSLSFLSLYFARYCANEQGMVSSWWLVFSYCFQSLGELLVSALGVAMVAELVPARIAGYVMGMWFLVSAMAGFLGATVASYTALPEHIKPGMSSLMIYTDVFASIGVVTLGVALLMWLLAPRLTRYAQGAATQYT